MKNAKTAARQKQIKQHNHLHTSQQQSSNPTLRFTPYAWAKLVYLRDVGETEIGGFGISAAGEPMLIEDITLIRQQCDWASVTFDDESVADFFEEQVEAGRQPSEFARLWIHTHPGNCPLPSATDEATLERVFGGSDWAVMFILARDGSYYARLRFNAGPGGALEVPVEVDYCTEFSATDQLRWYEEYQANVSSEPEPLNTVIRPAEEYVSMTDEHWCWDEDSEDDINTDRWMLTPRGEEVVYGAPF
jgi:hypothetical protein